MMKKHWVRTAIAATLLAGSGASMAELTGNVAVVSDYVFDGVSQTDNGPALQGGVDYAMESGLYVGFWGSTVDFGPGTDSNLETDWYIGYGFGDENVAFDFGFVWYQYLPTDDDIDYSEIWVGVTFAENFTLKYWYADDYANLGVSSSRLKATYSVAINDDWSIPLEYTFTDPEEGDSYNHFKIGAATAFDPINVELSYQKTDIDDEGDDDFGDIVYSDGGLVLSLSMDF